jgi:hypothetical protein
MLQRCFLESNEHIPPDLFILPEEMVGDPGFNALKSPAIFADKASVSSMANYEVWP